MKKRIGSKNFITFLFVIMLLAGAVIYIFVYSGFFIKKTNEKVNLNLSWVHQAEFSGNYMAKEKNFYKEAGLDVNIIPFNFEHSVVDLVVKDDVSFGIIGSDQLILARNDGYPVKAIAAIYKTSPAVMYSLKEKNIIRPQDFIGKTVGLEKGSNASYLYSAMMNNLNIDRSKIIEIETGHGVNEILSGKVDVSTGYIMNEPNLVEEAGGEVNIILMADYGVHLYGDVIFTTDYLIKNNPDLVSRFLKATLDGWQYAVENQEETAEVVFKYTSNNSTIEHQYYMLKDTVPFVVDGFSFLGWMERDHWERAHNLLLSQGLLSKIINTNDLYTVEFLANYYLNKKR